MTLEQLVTDLAMSQQLRDAGFPQATAMVWCQPSWGLIEKGLPYVDTQDNIYRPKDDDRLCSAPTAGELEEWLSVNNLRRFITVYYEPYEPIERRWSVASDLAKKPEPNLSTCRAETLVSALAALVLEVAG